MPNKQDIAKNFIWRLMERIGAQGVTLIISIVLARILDPEVYGTVALITVFTTILETFISNGIGTALVQKKETDDLDFSSVFYFNLFTCLVLYLLMFLLAPFIAAFYNRPELIPLVRVLSLTLIIAGVKNVQQAYVARHMLFKNYFFATLGGTIGAGIIGIILALNNFGVWAIVIQSIFNNAVDTLILWGIVKWRPQKAFSFYRLKTLYAFGWKILVSSLLEKIYGQLRSLLIGKYYSSADLAYYHRGEQFPQLIVNNINSSIDSILLPTMSQEQDNKNRVREMTRRAIKTSTYIIMPIMVGLAVCAEPIIIIVLTDKWLPAVFFLRIFCFTYAFFPLHTANLNAIKALGRSDLFLKLEIIKKIVGLIALLSTIFISVKAMALSLLVTSVLGQVINSWPNRKLLDYHYGDQLRDMLPQIILSCIMGICVYCIGLISLESWMLLLIQIPTGIFIYVISSKVFHIDSFDYVIGIAKGLFHKKEKT